LLADNVVHATDCIQSQYVHEHTTSMTVPLQWFRKMQPNTERKVPSANKCK